MGSWDNSGSATCVARQIFEKTDRQIRRQNNSKINRWIDG